MARARHPIESHLAHVPEQPGVYLWKDSKGEVLYVGKAKELRRRMKQYVTGHDERERIAVMMESVTSFDYVVTSTESESLILEVNLIRQFNPPYNIDFKDDKSYPFIAVTSSDKFPAIKFTREKRKAGTKYFGPYTDSRAARQTIDTLRRAVPFCRCTCPEWKRVTAKSGAITTRECFDSHIGLGPGVCCGAVTRDEYQQNVDAVVKFLSGDSRSVEKQLYKAMLEASDELDFEAAARYKARLAAIESLKEQQTVVADPSLELDVIGFWREENMCGVYVLVVREGRVQYGNEFTLDKGEDTELATLVSGFITRYYGEATYLAKEIVVEARDEDSPLIEEYLSGLRASVVGRESHVRLTIPSRGVKKRLLEMAQRNARHALMRYKVRTHYEDDRKNAALLQIESALGLSNPPMRIECVDISTLHGTHSVGSLVVFTDGKPNTRQYRRFKVRIDTGEANDIAMMREVLSRRFAQERREDARFGQLPDLLIVDGGPAQLRVAQTVCEELGVSIAIAGLAKREEELFVTWSKQPVILPSGSESFYLVKRIRDEAHRFAIEYHRLLRSKAMSASVLDEVVGLGPKRRKQLMAYFGSYKKLHQASVEEISAVKGIPEAVARDIHGLLHTDWSSAES